MERRDANGDGHDGVREQYDETASIYEEGRARMALYHRHCQDPVIFRTLGETRGKSLLDLACGNGFYTRHFRRDCGADLVMGVDLSPMLIRQAEAAEVRDPLGYERSLARSGYIPRIMGVLLVMAGLGYVINYLRPFLFPDLDLDFLFVAFFGELIFAVWLLARGRKIPEPAG